MSFLQAHPLIASPADTFDQWRRIAVAKTLQPFGKWIPASVVGGILIAVGTHAANALTAATSTPGDILLSGIALSCAITMVLISGSEFFTSNAAMVGTLYWGDQVPWWMYFVDLARKWVGNFVGALMWALLAIGSGGFGYDATASAGSFGALTPLGSHLCAVARSKADGPNAWELILRGGIIGVLVSIGIIAALGMHSPIGRMAPIFLCVPCAVLAGADHAISNMFIFTVATIIKCPVSNHGNYWRNLGLTTLGTMTFAFLVGSVMYAQNAFSSPPPRAQAATESHKSHEPDSTPASIVSMP